MDTSASTASRDTNDSMSVLKSRRTPQPPRSGPPLGARYLPVVANGWIEVGARALRHEYQRIAVGAVVPAIHVPHLAASGIGAGDDDQRPAGGQQGRARGAQDLRVGIARSPRRTRTRTRCRSRMHVRPRRRLKLAAWTSTSMSRPRGRRRLGAPARGCRARRSRSAAGAGCLERGLDVVERDGRLIVSGASSITTPRSPRTSRGCSQQPAT